MIGRDRITENAEYSCSPDLLDGWQIQRKTLEIRRMVNIGRLLAPFKEIAFLHLDLLPHIGTGENVRVPFLEHLGLDTGRNGIVDLLLGGPQIPEIDRLSV